MTKLPNLTEEPILHIDYTPDEDLPIRILSAYRSNCNVKWLVVGLPKEETKLYDMMNKNCDERAEILDRAIAKLKEQPHDEK